MRQGERPNDGARRGKTRKAYQELVPIHPVTQPPDRQLGDDGANEQDGQQNRGRLLRPAKSNGVDRQKAETRSFNGCIQRCRGNRDRHQLEITEQVFFSFS
ncbi:hypothetical protein D3C71_1738150 [compost metagenome]